MKRVLILLRASITSSYNSLSKKDGLRPIFAIGIGIAGTATFYLIEKFAHFLFNLSSRLNFPVDIAPIILNVVLFVAFLYMMLVSFSIMLSVLYFSSDTQLLLSLPFKDREVFTSRFIFTFLEESIWLIVLMYPFFVGYGILHSANILFYIETFLFVVLYPVIPFSISVFIILPLARKFHPKKLQAIFMIINVVLGIGIYIVSQLANPAYGLVNPQTFKDLFSRGSSIFQFLPTNIGVIFIRALAGSRIFFGSVIFLFYIAVSIGILYLGVIISTNSYKIGLGKFEAVETVRISLKSTGQGSGLLRFLPQKIQAIVGKDLKMIRRDQKLFVQILPVIAYMAVFFFIFVVALGRKTAGVGDFNSSLFMPIFFFSSTSGMLGTVSMQIFYHEGVNAWVVFSSKISGRDFIWSKFIIPFLMNEILNLIFFLLMLFVNKPPLYFILTIASFAFFWSFLLSSISVFLSSTFPIFKEAPNPKKAVPGRVNFVNMIIIYVLIAISFGVSFLQVLLAKIAGNVLSGFIIFAFISVISLSLGFVLISEGAKKLKYVEIQ